MKVAEASTIRYKKQQPLGILDGVPFGVKDDLEVKGYKRYIGSSHDYTEGGAKETSWCAKKLEEEGAILVGKLNMHELGMGKSLVLYGRDDDETVTSPVGPGFFFMMADQL